VPKLSPKDHGFTATIRNILAKRFGEDADEVFDASPLIGYLNKKTRSATQGSKARGSFANHYALYVVLRDYVDKGFLLDERRGTYSKYEGARHTDLMKAQRALPFGSKLQNHGLNGRLNDEFRKYYPSVDKPPIIRDVVTQRYWFHEDLLVVSVRRKDGESVPLNIAEAVLEIIESYAAAKRAAFEKFLNACKEISELGEADPIAVVKFVRSQLEPNVDARVFEIVSYAVLKAKYGSETIWIGDSRETVSEEALVLYKTGRTNANDGGIDFVMRPKGRFFQVTETVDTTKYFLDIDKVQRFPITFVVKTALAPAEVSAQIRAQAVEKFKVDAVVDRYMAAIEEIITTTELLAAFAAVVDSGRLRDVMLEVIAQSKVEFNYEEVAIEAESEIP